jgi:hypothetical protein
MSKSYNITIPVDEHELHEMLFEGKSFEWTFVAENEEGVEVNVTLEKENNE